MTIQQDAKRLIRAVIYCRISRDKVGAGLGVERQETDCRALGDRLAEQLGADVVIVAVLSDNDVSAYSGRRRKDYDRLCQMLRAGEVDVVLTWHNDRLHRSPRELEDYIDLSNMRSVPTYTCTAGDYDLTTSNGRFQARLAGVIARRESEHRAERVSAAVKQRVHAGKYAGGPRPFGFETGAGPLRPDEAAEIADGVHTVLGGGSLRSKVESLNARGILTTTGKTWDIGTWRQVLTRPRNAGIQTYKGVEIGPAPWEAIVDEADFRTLVALLADPSRRSSPGNTPKWFGSLLYGCGADGCADGHLVHGKRSKCPNPIYRCRSRTGRHAVRDAESLDEFVVSLLLERLSRPDAVELLETRVGEDLGALLAEKAALEAQLDALGMAVAEEGLNPRTAAVATRSIEVKISAVDQRISAAAFVDPLAAIVGAEDVAARWDELHLDQHRAILRELLEVTVHPVRFGSRAGGPDDPREGLTLHWRRGEQPAQEKG